ncbi:hypothetical protein LZ31DRAFT_347377 [Colletotrichum somersetense]|nr:hypothetical protein LZ31DRAFT_347377 [Colletotrichum somersetense]
MMAKALPSMERKLPRISVWCLYVEMARLMRPDSYHHHHHHHHHHYYYMVHFIRYFIGSISPSMISMFRDGKHGNGGALCTFTRPTRTNTRYLL